MKATVVKLNAEIAKKYLKQNTNNRALSAKAHLYALDMKEGRWKENGESIVIDKNGVLKNGQHRLSATVIANHTWYAVLVTEVEPDVMDTIDTGKKRTLGDVLKIEGYKNCNNLGGIANAILNFNQGRVAAHGIGSKAHDQKFAITNKIGIDYIKKNEKMLLTLTELAVHLYPKQATKIFPTSDIGLFFYIVTNKGKASFENPMVVKFIKLVLGINADENTATTWFYKKMLKYKQSHESVSRRWMLGIFIKCWNLYIEGNPPITSMSYDIKTELPKPEFPKVDFFKK